MDETGKQSEQLLTYAPASPVRSRWVVRSIVAFLLASGILLALHGFTDIWRRLQIVYWQHECLTYANPTGPAPATAAWPHCWQEMKRLLDGPSAIIANNPTAYCGPIQNDVGETRLLVVQPDSLPNSSVVFYALIQPSLLGTPTALQRSSVAIPPSFFSGPITRYDYAALDPAHANHLSIGCIVGGQPRTLDLWLKKDLMLIEARGHP